MPSMDLSVATSFKGYIEQKGKFSRWYRQKQSLWVNLWTNTSHGGEGNLRKERGENSEQLSTIDETESHLVFRSGSPVVLLLNQLQFRTPSVGVHAMPLGHIIYDEISPLSQTDHLLISWLLFFLCVSVETP